MASSKEKTTTRSRKKVMKPKKKKEKKISFHKRPEEMTLEMWQMGLRKQFGKESGFILSNIGDHPVFSDFAVKNPDTGNTYRVAIRSRGDSNNFCSCMDFKTNRLGVCKHIGFVQHKLETKRGIKRILKAGFQQAHSSIYLDYQDGRKLKLSIGTENQTAFDKLAKKYFDQHYIIKFAAYSKFEKILEEAQNISEDFRCYDDALEFVLGRRELLKRNKRLEVIFSKGLVSPRFKKLVNVELYEYQKKGVLFAARAGRSLIADEMGLGKTIQAIAASELYMQEFGVSKILIVCPTSLKYQWKTEIERFTKSKAHVVEGSVLKRRQQYANEQAPYLIVGYHTVKNDLSVLNEMDIDILILDEAQRIKNWATQTSAAIKKLNSTYAFVLTGTPLENKLEELYSIMQVIDQFRLPPLYAFLNQYQIQDESGRVVGFKNLKNIAKTLSDVLLRRTKKKVLKQLPKRMDKTLLVPMTVDQKIIHDEFKEVVAKLVARWRRQRFLKEKDRKRLMLSLSQMRMVCDSTYILDQTTRHDTKISELMAILEEFFTNDDQGKVVIFSQWKRMLDLVQTEMEDREVGYRYLHGSVQSSKRGDLIKDFINNPDCHVFLSTDAGGVGLNLQAASLVISLDIPWNPAVLEQRIARVWRMGQESAVQVINLVSAGTIEHRMLGILKFKDSMAKGVLDDGQDVIFMEQSRFNEFMGKMEDLTGGQWVSDTENQATIEEENAEIAPKPQHEEQPEPAKEGIPELIPGDDDVPESAPSHEQGHTTRMPNGTPASPDELIQVGVSFLSGLAKTLSSPQETQKLVSSITAKDEETGQTYLKIPVQNEAMVSNALQMIGGLFQAFKQ